MEIYLVGGAVRDELLGYPIHERDYVVVGASPEKMAELGYTPIGKDFPVFLHPQTKDEYALARTERKSARGYKGFTFNAAPSITLEEDLIRRDLSINAIAKAQDDTFIDPYGGRKDIEARRLRHVSLAFREDPVRILRVARFSARYHHLGFQVADDTMSLMQEMVANGEVDFLVAERVWKEFSRALEERHPEVFLSVLNSCGALARVMPPIADLISQDIKNHPAIQALRQAAIHHAKPHIRFACLMSASHTPEVELKKFYRALAIPNEFNELAALTLRLQKLIADVQRSSAAEVHHIFTQSDALRRPERFYELLQVCAICARSKQEVFPQAAFLQQAFAEVQHVKPKDLLAQGYSGKALGEALTKARITRLETLLPAPKTP